MLAQVAVYPVLTVANEVVAPEVVAADGFNFKTYIVMEYCDKGTLESHRCALWYYLLHMAVILHPFTYPCPA